MQQGYNYLQGADDVLNLISGVQQGKQPSNIIFSVISNFLNNKRQKEAEDIEQSDQMAFDDRIANGEIKAPAIPNGDFTIPYKAPDNNITLPKPFQYPGGIIQSNLDQQIAMKESKGNYQAYNPANGGEGAVGKYQFRWHLWKDKIAAITGIDNKDAFLKSPSAQENFYSWYKEHELLPAVNRIKPYNHANYNDNQLARLVHFKGEAGAKQWLLNGTDRTKQNNSTIENYLDVKQAGGVALSPDAQATGLNNTNYDRMYFPMSGMNTFRGLDDGKPVLIRDSIGNEQILLGPQDTMQTFGPVKEQRLQSGWLDKYR